MATEALQFLSAVFTEIPEGSYIRIWLLAKEGRRSESRYFPTAESAAEFCSTITDRHCYFGVALGPDTGPNRRGTAMDAKAIGGMWADIDIAGDGHADKSYPSTIEEALTPLLEFPPTTVIHSGGGLQAYWLFKEMEIFESDAERQAMADLAERWKRYLKYRYQQRGLAIDSVQDLARVLRVPGTWNLKTDTPRPVRILEHNENRRCNPSDLVDFMDELGIPASAPNQSGPTVSVDSGLALDGSAEIPPMLLEHLLQNEPKFAAIWNRRRSDFTDQSQSSYDQAIANFLCRDCDDQTVVNAMIHHRRIGGHKQKLRLKYYCDTLANAKQGMKLTGSAPVIPPDVEIPGLQRPKREEAPPPPPQDAYINDEDIRRCRSLEAASERLGVEILKIVQIEGTGEPSRYQVYIKNCQPIHFDHPRQFAQQAEWNFKIMERARKVMPGFKPKGWAELCDLLLAGVEVKSGGDEMDLERQAHTLLDSYLLSNAIYTEADMENSESSSSPVQLEGSIHIQAGDVRRWKERTSRERLDGGRLVVMITSIGGVQSQEFDGRWKLPAEKFPPNMYVTVGRATKQRSVKPKGQPE